eukprot:scaffold118545_cov50-Phaeocystis_antarctica.AAC.2
MAPTSSRAARSVSYATPASAIIGTQRQRGRTGPTGAPCGKGCEGGGDGGGGLGGWIPQRGALEDRVAR